jgi:hypothetical protein
MKSFSSDAVFLRSDKFILPCFFIYFTGSSSSLANGSLLKAIFELLTPIKFPLSSTPINSFPPSVLAKVQIVNQISITLRI